MEGEPLGVERRLLLLPRGPDSAGLERFELADVGLLALRQRLALDDPPAADRLRVRGEPRERLVVLAHPLAELDELLTDLGRDGPRDRLDLGPSDDLDRVVPGLIDAKAETLRRADDPLPRQRILVVRAGPARVAHARDLGRVTQDRGQRPGRPRPKQLVLPTTARHVRRSRAHRPTPRPGAATPGTSRPRSSSVDGRTHVGTSAGRSAAGAASRPSPSRIEAAGMPIARNVAMASRSAFGTRPPAGVGVGQSRALMRPGRADRRGPTCW